jgi:hypothetical protein
MCHLSNKHTRQLVLRYREGKRYSVWCDQQAISCSDSFLIISTMFFFPLQQIICNACRMILGFFLDTVNGQEAQQIIIKLTSCGIRNVFDAFTTFNARKFSIFLDSLLFTKNTIVSVYLWQRVFIVHTEASLLVLLHSVTSLTNRCKFLLLG